MQQSVRMSTRCKKNQATYLLLQLPFAVPLRAQHQGVEGQVGVGERRQEAQADDGEVEQVPAPFLTNHSLCR